VTESISEHTLIYVLRIWRKNVQYVVWCIV